MKPGDFLTFRVGIITSFPDISHRSGHEIPASSCQFKPGNRRGWDKCVRTLRTVFKPENNTFLRVIPSLLLVLLGFSSGISPFYQRITENNSEKHRLSAPYPRYSPKRCDIRDVSHRRAESDSSDRNIPDPRGNKGRTGHYSQRFITKKMSRNV